MTSREFVSPVRRTSWPRSVPLYILDATVLLFAWGIAWTLRFEGLGWLDTWRQAALNHALLSVPLWLGIIGVFRLDRRVWGMASVEELEALLIAMGVAGFANVTLAVFGMPIVGLADSRLPLSVVASQTIWSIVGIALPRICARLARAERWRRKPRPQGRRVLVIGAGEAGRLTVREMLDNPHLGLEPIGYLDDDATKCGRTVGGVRVLGRTADLDGVLRDQDVRTVVLAVTNADGRLVREVVRTCTDANVETRTVPAMSEILAGRVGINQLRPVEIQDLLRRAPVETDIGAVRRIVEGNTVLVTGAGGSIGGELCRQLARHAPSQLVLLGHGENSIYEIQHELSTHFPHVPISTVIADVRDEGRIDATFARLRPHAVFHAAAHKHVPLMEENLSEAVTNNVKGTRVVVEACARHDVRHFVLISSDKAVNPTSIMGASKRIAELVVQRVAAATGRNYVSVRFGNVLGSRGSVVPMFLRQIRAGGPVTITHPDMTRYFMTIPEAVQLVLQAAVMGQGGEVFVLDMGEPVKIVDLATDLIKLSGLRVGKDIEIRFSGIRPGEKLFEELSRNDETMQDTAHAKVMCAKLAPPAPGVLAGVDALVTAAHRREGDDALRKRIADLVPEYVALGTSHAVRRPELSLVA